MATVRPFTRRYSSEFQTISSTPSNTFSKNTIRRLSSEFHYTSTRTTMSKISTSSLREEQYCMLSPKKSRSSRSHKDVLSSVCYASEKDSVEQHHKSLETYLESLQRDVEPETSKSVSDISEYGDKTRQAQASMGLQSLETYIAVLKEDACSEESKLFTTGRNMSKMTENSAVRSMNMSKQKSVYARKSMSSSLFNVTDSSSFYLISVLISMNIAVFLFEIASPIKNPDTNLWSLPLMYGAKVNDLIMVGEWWRLVTPMFLHAGVLHIALSSWMLLSFGPQVCKGYGAFTFFLIYLLGGITGNFASFLHTSDSTVGGSGPVFAVIGAWLYYQAQNKDAVGKENIETMFQKAIIATTFSFVLANFGPIDNWTNLGAVISGIMYGYFTSPVVQIDDASSSGVTSVGNTMKEEISLSKSPVNPCKSLLIFTLFVSALGSLLLFTESPLGTLELEELIQLVE